MEHLSQCESPGVLLVTARPTAPRYLRAFHEWYDTEHGPARLQLGDQFFLNGYRYRSTDNDPTWLAIYDMQRLSSGAKHTYTSLRENRSQREQEVLRKAVKVLSRQFWKSEADTGCVSGPAPVITCICFQIPASQAVLAREWYMKNIFAEFEGLSGCTRSRLFQLVDGTNKQEGYVSLLGIHDRIAHLTQDAELRIATIETLLQRRDQTVLLKPALRTYLFHRAFTAGDYIAPSENFILDQAKEGEESSKL